MQDRLNNTSAKKRYGQLNTSSIVVSFREEQGRSMHAAFFDHYLIRNITHFNTAISLATVNGMSTNERVQNFTKFVSA